MGFVEGVTEYLPVSSTGHLILAQKALGLESNAVSKSFAICIQAGAILAVLGIFRARVLEILRGIFRGDATGRRLAINIMIAFLPAAVLGLLFDHKIEKYLFGLWPVIAAWLVGGVAIFIFTRKPIKLKQGAKSLHDLTWSHALLIGFAQSLALWPGTSRSLVTIAAALFVGLEITEALEFSFLLGLLTLGAATSYKGLQHGHEMLSAFGPTAVAVGLLSAWLFAAVSVKWMIGYLQRYSMDLFGYWRVALALGTAYCLQRGIFV